MLCNIQQKAHKKIKNKTHTHTKNVKLESQKKNRQKGENFV